MRKITLFIIMIALWLSAGAQRYAGGDISLLPTYEKAGAKYLTHDGKPIADLLPWLREQGMNAMRVRLFVNPSKYKELHANDPDAATRYDPNACQDLEYITPLCKRITECGMDLMLDFHYSDTWADPAKQWTPTDWEGLSDEQLYERIYTYTRETLIALREQGIVPAFIQPGNEISYGMLWGPVGTDKPLKTFMGHEENWDRLGHLLRQAVKACREVCPEAKIVIHTERTQQPDVQLNFYDKMKELGVDYDIIGLSYYPYHHGNLASLDTALQSLQDNFPDKNIMIVETGYSYKWPMTGSPNESWPCSEEGQEQYARDLVNLLLKYNNCDGLFWWWMEYNAYGTDLQGWYNAPLFDSTTGRATAALKTICSFASSAGIHGVTTGYTDRKWFDISGRCHDRLPDAPGIYINAFTGRKILK